MRLTPTNTRKLNAALWREQFRRIAIAAAVGAVLIGLAVFANGYRLAHADATLDVRPVEASVVVKETTRLGRTGFVFHAKLADGRTVDAFASSGLAPPVGTRVILGEARHQSGRLTYDLVQSLD